jgi:NAD(P)-dependent dehydrogenase (short-subunit alcohol dehydrogenase family)
VPEAGVALVTGAGKRLGAAIAEGLAAQGYALALHYNASDAGAREVAARIADTGGRAVLLRRDLRAAETSGTLVADAAAELGAPVSVLVNSASSFESDSLTTLTAASWHTLMSVNATAPVFLMQAMAQQQPAPAGGAIVNVLDTQLTSASPERFSYFAGKFALDGATRVAAMALAPRGIRVNAVAPGLVLPSEQTDAEFLARQNLTPLGAGLGPADIVQAVSYLIGAAHVTGHTLVVDSGQHLMGFGNASLGDDRA